MGERDDSRVRCARALAQARVKTRADRDGGRGVLFAIMRGMKRRILALTALMTGIWGAGCAECGTEGYRKFQYASCSDNGWWAGGGETYPGVCKDRPASCDSVYEPVCGCDGKVYGNECTANGAGVDLGAEKCAASLTPVNFMPCGPLYCAPSATYCHVGYGDVGDRFWDCMPLPAACVGAATPDCACLGTLTGMTTCKVIEGNGVSGLEEDESLI